ncbi:hypothetical protein TC41_3250 [Alicyclobacillus acidocaldarius subsp. acidocaldarius Tc-4-1]|uniref:Uncharacterized protein n=1 Tax=Alicyclobacillus acidocaldarius (strain Tc-4-1) TaxID=1048834 RepID=F8IE91_ALIAT|nr:hypothetical protein TC41_3250 [Alicyclobacillus acidocaldarius subsp. acidocaldarius Tc-4-1]
MCVLLADQSGEFFCQGQKLTGPEWEPPSLYVIVKAPPTMLPWVE